VPTTPTEEPEVSIAPGRIELAQPIFFQLNRKRIRFGFRDELKQLARVLQRRPELTYIWIEGHADATGPEAWNMTLSRARAEAVAQFLISEGIAPSRLAPVGFGEARPMVPTPHGVPNERNRRVHFYTDAGPVQPEAAVSRAERK
jgi:outer membrane protein OmpA-like peptidoglycan-associated protein